MEPAALRSTSETEPSDEEIVIRVCAGETALFEILMRRYNQRLFRVAYAVLDDVAESEDVMQEAYVNAFAHLAQFEGRAKFATWLTKIAVYEAISRARKRRRLISLGDRDTRCIDDAVTPEAQTNRSHFVEFLDRELARLPVHQRLIFTLRDLEQFNTAETARCVGVSEQNVKVTLHRARNHLRKQLQQRLGISLRDLHTFGGGHCDQMVTDVLAQISRTYSWTG